MSNAQIWYALIAGTVLALLAIIVIGQAISEIGQQKDDKASVMHADPADFNWKGNA